MMKLPLLSILIWFPIVGGCLLLGLSRESYLGLKRFLALGVSVISFALSLMLLQGFDTGSYAMQWTESHPWVFSMGIHYSLGIDGFSLPLIILNCFMTILVVLASYRSVTVSVNRYL